MAHLGPYFIYHTIITKNSHKHHRHLRSQSCYKKKKCQHRKTAPLEIKLPMLTLDAHYPRMQSLYAELVPFSASCCHPCARSDLRLCPSIIFCSDRRSTPKSCRRRNRASEKDVAVSENKKRIAALRSAHRPKKGLNCKVATNHEPSEMRSPVLSWKWEKAVKGEEEPGDPEGAAPQPPNHFLNFPSEFNLSSLHASRPSPLPPSPPSSPAPGYPEPGETEDSGSLLRGLEEEMRKLILQRRDRRHRCNFSASHPLPQTPPPSSTLLRKEARASEVLRRTCPTSPVGARPRGKRARERYEGPPWVPP